MPESAGYEITIGPEETLTKQGYSYEITYYVTSEAGLTAVWLNEGDPATFLDRTGITAYVTQCKRNPIVAGSKFPCLVTINAQSWRFGNRTTNTGMNPWETVEQEYGTDYLHMNIEWWGIRIATRSDAGYNSNNEQTLPRFKNINDVECNPGDYVFHNAVIDGAYGTNVQSDNCPFDTNSLTTNYPITSSSSSTGRQIVGQSVPCHAYRVAFFDRYPLNTSYIKFVGISGSAPSRLKPLLLENKKWRATGQTIKGQYFGDNLYYKIERTMQYVPFDVLDWAGPTWNWSSGSLPPLGG
jgi:hypothetical protein